MVLSGCSRHMMANKWLFISILEYNVGRVTFGDGATTKNCGKGIIDCVRMPNIENFWSVASLNANLISISQLCDEGYKVNFPKEACMVNDKNGETVIKAQHTYDKCYGILSQGKSKICNSTIANDTNLWHQYLEHIN